RCSMRGSHDQVYGGGLIFQTQSMVPVFHGLEVFGSRGPSPAGVKEILLRNAGKTIVRNLILSESPIVADSSALVSEIKFPRPAIADGACVIFLAQWFH